jgi:MFS family permease
VIRRILVEVGPLRSPDFRRLWAAGVVTSVGSQLTVVAVPVQIYAISGSSADVGLAGLIGFVPMAMAALWGGAVADVVDRRRVLLVTNGGLGVTSILLWGQASAHLRSVVALLVIVTVQQALFGAGAAVSGAVVPRLVPVRDLAAAIALQSTVIYFAGVAGPLLAGGLLSVAGSQTLYLLDAVALCATLWAVWRLPSLPPLPPLPAGDGGVRRAALGQIVEGLRLLAAGNVLPAAYLADFIALFFGLPAALFPQLARASFGVSHIGVLYAAISAGGVAAGLFSGGFTRIRRHGVAVATAVCLWGLAIAGFGLARSLTPAASLLALAGGMLVVLSVFRKAILQTVATDGLRGRLQGVDTVVAAGGPRLAGFVHGAAGAAFGTTWTITGGGLLTVVAMLALLWAAPDFRRYRRP